MAISGGMAILLGKIIRAQLSPISSSQLCGSTERDFSGIGAGRWAAVGVLSWILVACQSMGWGSPMIWGADQRPFQLQLVDADNGWPVPLVELRTTDQVRYVSDNAGIIAVDDPSLMNRATWFSVIGHGYGVAADGFGYQGLRITPQPGQTQQIKLTRRIIAERVGRLTGRGLFAESQKLGAESDWLDGPIAGCDSVQVATHRGQLYWAWGDTKLSSYPLGVFHMTSATSEVNAFAAAEPPLRPNFNFFLDSRGRVRAVAEMPGSGPTWLTGYVSLPDSQGAQHLVAFYRKIRPPLETYESGLCKWNEQQRQFEHLQTVWEKTDPVGKQTLIADGHPALWTDTAGVRWLYFGNPLPHVRMRASFEDWQAVSEWQALRPQPDIPSAADQKPITPHSGSIAWNAYRQRWVTVFMQKFGQPSAFGTLWYAEADSPVGPWEHAVEVLSHDNYTFYNPRLHPTATQDDSPWLYFEGTYTAEFANHAQPTPLYDYNQILYRLDLRDPRLGLEQRDKIFGDVDPQR